MYRRSSASNPYFPRLLLFPNCSMLGVLVRVENRLGVATQSQKREEAHRVMPDPMIAYCGPAPVPTDIWTRWNLDPLLMTALAVLALVVARGRSSETRAGWAAIVLMVVIFVSPFCALSSSLFSVRVLHHVLLVAAVAPLLALAFPL